jgi:GR25 family glycosyltransferase involved in LPS biosynthesis
MLMNNYFDKIYCINLDRRTDRWDEVSKVFETNKLIVERHTAFDGKKELTLPYPSSSELAGAISHRDVILKAKELGLKNVLIFEDDVELIDDINEVFNNIKDYIPNDWDMIYFGGNHVGGLIQVNDYFFRCIRTYALHMYAVNEKSYDLIIKYLSDKIKWVLNGKQSLKPSVAADYFISDIHQITNTYVVKPYLSWQKEGYSDIQESVMNYDFLRNK